MTREYIKAEKLIEKFMAKGAKFIKDGKEYQVINSGKPKTNGGHGEPKTDIYILSVDKSGETEEIKISYKKTNADFIENKLSSDRAEQILGIEWKNRILRSIKPILNEFAEREVVYIEKKAKTEKGAITLGWRYDLLNKKGGELSALLKANKEEVIEAYKGNNLQNNKKHAKVHGEVVENSGIATYILIGEEINSTQDIINKMVLIEDYVNEYPDLYFACKAVNYRTFEEKYESSRPIAVSVNWHIIEQKLTYSLNFNSPLEIISNEYAKKLKEILKNLDIKNTDGLDYTNFEKPKNIDIVDIELTCTEDRVITTNTLEKGFVGMKQNERGRGKFKPAPDYSVEDVRSLLFQKIEEERQNFESCSHSIDFNNLSYKEGKFNLLSLFSGCGGLDLGFELAGLQAIVGEQKALNAIKDKTEFDEIRKQGIFHTIYANDFFTEATQSYDVNFPDEVRIDSSDIRKIKDFPKADIVLGGFPCPGFSEAGPRLIDDERNFLYIHFIRCLMQSKPLVFVAENVKGMMTLGKGEVFNQIVQDFAAAGYTIHHKLLNSRDYGVPQIRERVLLVGVRNDINFSYQFPTPTHGEDKSLKPFVTLRDAIWDLRENPGDYFTGSYSTIFMSRNRKKGWDEQSFTIQASGRQAPIHPDGMPMEKLNKDKWIFPDGEENNRRLSVKEIKRIQTFPDWYYLSDGKNDGTIDNGRLDKIYKQVGNAVPVLLARAVAYPIAQWATQYISNQNSFKQI